MENALTEFAQRQSGVNPVLDWSIGSPLEWQINAGGEFLYRNVRFGDTTPQYKDFLPDWIPASIVILGGSGWNAVDLRSEWGGIDLDSLVNHIDGLTPERLDEYVAAIAKLPYCQIQRSKSGVGYHIFGYFDRKLAAQTRSDHKRNVERFALQIQKKHRTPPDVRFGLLRGKPLAVVV